MVQPQVTDIQVDGVSTGSVAGYTFQWFESDGTTVVAASGSAATIATAIAAGDYFVQATNTASNCSTSLTPFTINNITVNPTIVASTNNSNTNCIGATPNGTITVQINGGAPVADFTIEWFEGNTTTTPLGTTVGVVGGANNETASQLSAGIYTVRVTDNVSPGNSCSSTATFTVTDDLPVIAIEQAALTLTHQADCNPADGSAQVTDIQVDGVSTGSVAGYTFQWFESDGTTVVAASGSAATIATAIAAGNYFVQATNTASNCSTSLTPFTINNITVNPTIVASTNNSNTNCIGATPNGTITVQINGGAPVADFTIEWFEGNTTTTPLGTTVGVVGGANDETASQLSAGTYTVRVTDNVSPGNSCSSTATFTVTDDLPVIAIEQAALTLTHQADCNPADGSAQVTDIQVDGVSTGSVAGYTFQWFESDGTTVVAASGSAATIGTAIAAGDYFVQATNTASNCSTSLTPFTINNITVNPTIVASTNNSNTNCIGATPNGTITVQINGGAPVADFTIEWFEGNTTTTPLGTTVGVVGGANDETASQLSAGTYTVRVTDNVSPGNSCSSTATFTVTDDLPVIAIEQAALTLTHQADCNPADGSAQVTDIQVDGVSTGSVAGYTFQWFESDGTTVVAASGSAATIATAIAAGDYFVQATNTASNCSTSLTPFTINNITVNPTIVASTNNSNTNCIGATPNGTITVQINGGAPVADFTIEWFEGNTTTTPLGTTVGVVGGANDETASQLSAGTYTVRVTDNVSPGNSCSSTATFTVTDDLPVIAIEQAALTLTHQADCNPADGSAQVTDIQVDGVSTGSVAGYTFQWFESDGTTVVAASGSAATIATAIAAGDYFVQATNTASNCSSALTAFTINDISVNPTVVIVQNSPNLACNTSYTGELSASVTEGTTTGVTTGYTFEWFRGANNTNAADFISTGITLSGVQEGDYTVRVTDIASAGNGCIGIATLYLEREIPIYNNDVITTAQTQCAPTLDGSIEVTTVRRDLMGTTRFFDMNDPAELANFSFQWFDAAQSPITAVVAGDATSPNLTSGTYYVQSTDNLGCTSLFTIAIIDDQTTPPTISLDAFTNPAVCILPEVTGSLSVIADNNPNFGNYTFQWYQGNVASGAVVDSDNELNDIPYTATASYTIRVTNNTTHCFSDATFKFKTDTVAVQTLASATPLTSCITTNGSLFATVPRGDGSLYDYDWYTGPVVSGNPVYTGNIVTIAPMGVYTAIAKHPTLNFCTILPDTATVTDSRIYPAVNITPMSPLTYCDPAKLNGAANADVGGTIIGYTFDWFEGSISGTPHFTGSAATNLAATTYVVRATDVISGCTGNNSITITSDPMRVPVPQVVLVANRTDCEIPNGILSASVNGNISDYSFNWYDGGAVKPNADATGDVYWNLNAGQYAVTAIDDISGCASDPVIGKVDQLYVYPEFMLKTTPALCTQQNGTANLIVLNGSDIQSIEWNINGTLMTGPSIGELPAGTHTVTAITSLHCEKTETVIVKTEINVYNAVSHNNDGMNDFFEIGCLEEFKNNHVRIFNRAGTLVYEQRGYNNQDLVFNGVSNRGISILGNGLPDGTYFYIIDKGDGSEAKTGYLELLK